MGLENLINYLQSLVPEERSYIIEKAYERMLILFGDAFNGDIDALLEMIQDQDVETQLKLIDQQTLQFLSQALANYGVTVNSEVVESNDIDTLSELLGGFIELDDYEDPVSLYTCLEQGGFTQDSILEMFEIYTDKSYSDYAEVVESISDSVISTMSDLLKEMIENLNQDEDVIYSPLPNSLIKMVRDESIRANIHPDLLAQIAKKPVHLSTISLLRVFGNRIGDMGRDGVTSWVALYLYSTDDEVSSLTDNWSKHFLDESIIPEVYNKVTNTIKQLEVGNNEA